ncbi:MAG: LacI family DNA-binding transcriptional regulator [Planctomycetota bacterium]
MTVTIDDIATRTGVSRMTVSRALRGVGRMSDRTRKRVQQAAEDLAYRPNSSARAMSRGRFGAVGMLFETSLLRSSIPPPFISHLTAELARRGLRLVIGQLDEQRMDDPDYLPDFVREWAVDGVITNYHHDLPEHITRSLDGHGSPWVQFNRKADTAAVYPDDHAAGRDLNARLIARGHRRIAYLDMAFHHQLTPNRHYSREDRLAGYTDAMKAAGLEPIVLLDEEPSGRRGFLHGLHGLLRDPAGPSAILGYDDSVFRTVESLRVADPSLREAEVGGFFALAQPHAGVIAASVNWPAIAKALCDAVDLDRPRSPQPVAVAYDLIEGPQLHPPAA